MQTPSFQLCVDTPNRCGAQWHLKLKTVILLFPASPSTCPQAEGSLLESCNKTRQRPRIQTRPPNHLSVSDTQPAARGEAAEKNPAYILCSDVSDRKKYRRLGELERCVSTIQQYQSYTCNSFRAQTCVFVSCGTFS